MKFTAERSSERQLPHINDNSFIAHARISEVKNDVRCSSRAFLLEIKANSARTFSMLL